MADTLRDKLINKGWVTPFNADTLVRLIEEHYAELAKPVPVSERLPGPEDCAPWPGEPNAGLWCWMASCVDNGWAWEQRTLGFLASFPQDFTHWLSAHALPIPHQQENAND